MKHSQARTVWAAKNAMKSCFQVHNAIRGSGRRVRGAAVGLDLGEVKVHPDWDNLATPSYFFIHGEDAHRGLGWQR